MSLRDTARAMSEENIEIVRRLFDAVARRDAKTVLAFYDPEVEWDASGSPMGQVVGPRVYHGHDGLREAFREWHESWGHVEDEISELIDAGDDVIVVTTMKARGRSSGVGVEWTGYASVWTIRDALVTRVVWFPTRTDALQAAGLSE